MLNLMEVLNVVNAPTGIRRTSKEVIVVIKSLSFSLKWGQKPRPLHQMMHTTIPNFCLHTHSRGLYRAISHKVSSTLNGLK
jgi:hypothetical protein